MTNTVPALTATLSQLGDITSLILSVVALIITIVGFFASLKFYREGMALQQLANEALVKIEEKASSIQTQVGGMFEKTLEAAIANKERLQTDLDEINHQLKKTGKEIVDAALKEIGSASTAERDKLKGVVEHNLQQIRQLVDATRASAEEVVVNPVRQTASSSLQRLLNVLQSTKEWLSINEIAERSGLPPSLTSIRLRHLLEMGRVERKRDEGQRVSSYRIRNG